MFYIARKRERGSGGVKGVGVGEGWGWGVGWGGECVSEKKAKPSLSARLILRTVNFHHPRHFKI